MSLVGYFQPFESGRSTSAPPPASDINLFGEVEGIIDLYAQVSDGALHFRVAQQDLDRSQIASLPIDQGCLGSP